MMSPLYFEGQLETEECFYPEKFFSVYKYYQKGIKTINGKSL